MNAGRSAPLQRVLYTSRAADPAADWQALARCIADHAARTNPAAGITGLLLAANGHFLQMLDGPADAVGALYERIARDPRHTDVRTTRAERADGTAFATWSTLVAERAEPVAATAGRFERLREQLAGDPLATTADYVKLVLVPGAESTRVARAADSSAARSGVLRVALVHPGGLWDAAIVQHLTPPGDGALRRTRLTEWGTAVAPSAVIDYVDLMDAQLGALRVLALGGEAGRIQAISPLLAQLDLLVLLLSPSDMAGLPGNVRPWLMPLGAAASGGWPVPLGAAADSGPPVLVLAHAGPEALIGAVKRLRDAGVRSVRGDVVRLREADVNWARICVALRALKVAPAPVAAIAAVPVLAPPAAAVAALLPLPAPEPALEPQRAASPDFALPLQRLSLIDGCRHAAILQTEPHAVLGLAAGAAAVLPREAHAAALAAALADAHWLRDLQALHHRLHSGNDRIEDIVVVGAGSLQVLRPLRSAGHRCLSVLLDAGQASVAAARLGLQDIDDAMPAA